MDNNAKVDNNAKMGNNARVGNNASVNIMHNYEGIHELAFISSEKKDFESFEPQKTAKI